MSKGYLYHKMNVPMVSVFVILKSIKTSITHNYLQWVAFSSDSESHNISVYANL